MPSERIQRRIDAFLDEAEEAAARQDWAAVAGASRAVLAIDATNEDATAFLQMALANGVPENAANGITQDATTRTPARVATEERSTFEGEPARSVIEAAAIVEQLEASEASAPSEDPSDNPTDFAGGRYKVLRFLGEGGKKRVFLAHDALLDRDVAFSLIKTEGLDDEGRQRITREAQAMGRLAHQNIVAIYDIGEHTAADGTKQPYLVQELMAGGDVEALLEASETGLPLPRALEIALATARGLEFAHAQGVIHRDLKPGNVWLTSDGEAKIGDLGLAVTIGQSRLTTHGMMVGTYGYMPPEQALGQEVTPQADLYSLGAMLYELVTGRPPFQGDAPTAVISQHLNTQPVAPSWHSDHCPPNLEALILHLLAKVPADRPGSASEVIAALEAVDPEGRSTSHSDSAANPLDRLARGVFVGRERELEQLREGLDGALAGRGSVVMLVGEPGIGKTRAVQELETYARMRGAAVYWGRTHESAGMPAYWPWQQVGNAWGAQQDFNSASIANAVANPELQRLFPDLRQVVPTLPEPPEPRSPESAQFLMFDAWTQFMRAQATATPWVVVLDDLHWSDKPTLQLLQYAARELANMNVLIVGTYRDTDLVRTHPLSETLAELNRESGFVRIPLKGLSRDEVTSYVHQRAGTDPVPALIDRLYEETEGNPFFLSEMVNLMVDEGTLDSTSVSDMALPDGVREALGRRLDRLSEDANELLQTAAVVGREFAHETLDLLSEHDADALLGLIEEGLRARVIEESDRPGRYRFTHALMQETLLEELSTTRRVRMHGQVAEALEQRYGDRAEEQAELLAVHYSESATLNAAHAMKAVSYARAAGVRAEDRAAWAEATRHYAAALSVAENGRVETDVPLAELLSALGIAAGRAGEPRIAWRSLLRAVDLFSGVEDWSGLAGAVIGTEGVWAPRPRKRALLDRALEHADALPLDLHATLLLLRASINAIRDEAEADVSLARSLVQDPLSSGLRRLFVASEASFAALDADFERALEAVSTLPGLGAGRGPLLMKLGPLDEAKAALEDRLAPARLQGRLQVESTLGYLDAVAILRWDEAASDELVAQISSGHLAHHAADMAMRYVTGTRTELEGILPDVDLGGGESYLSAFVYGQRARALYLAGEFDRARREMVEWDTYCSRLLEESPQSYSDVVGSVGDALPALGAIELVDAVYRWITAAPQLRTLPPGYSADVWRGQLALRLELADEAEQHFRTGLDWCERERCPIEAGRAHQGLADVAEQRGDLEPAREHLDAAGALFSQYGAKLYLDQVIAKKEILKA